MIIDSHGHVFPPLGGPSGFRTAREHLRYVQHPLLFHHQPVNRLSDNAIVEREPLYDGRDLSLDGLIEADFRGGGHGKLLWTRDGEDYSTQYLPPTLTRLSAPPELMVAQMDYVGVDKAVLQSGHLYGRLNRYLADAVAKYPDRFWAMALVDEWRVDQAGQIRSLDRAINELGLHGVWFQTGHLKAHKRTERLTDPLFRPFWDAVRDMGVPVFWHVTSAEPGPEAFIDELEALAEWTQLYPDVQGFFTHGIPLSRFMAKGNVAIPERVWTLLGQTNTLAEILIPIFQSAVWDYPYAEARPVIGEYYERLGPSRLAWGSDMPNVERHCTYRQSLDYLRLYCDFIPKADMELICGGNVAHLFGG